MITVNMDEINNRAIECAVEFYAAAAAVWRAAGRVIPRTTDRWSDDQTIEAKVDIEPFWGGVSVTLEVTETHALMRVGGKTGLYAGTPSKWNLPTDILRYGDVGRSPTRFPTAEEYEKFVEWLRQMAIHFAIGAWNDKRPGCSRMLKLIKEIA